MDSPQTILNDVDSHLRSYSTTSTYSETATLATNSRFAQPGGTKDGSKSAESPRSPRNGSELPAIIPPVHPFRTLVLCFDGTGDQFDSDNSNIVELLAILKKDDPNVQMVYYQAGIGTYTIPQIATPFMAKLSKTLDEMIAWNLDAHIMGGYEFLMQNYRVGDRICIFGFSRGAYTARCLAGMIHKVGLLPSGNHQQVPFAYKMYSKADEEGWEQSNAFKHAFAMDVDIEFVGVWDTVNSVGLIPRRLPFASSNTIIKTFRHAVSLDERRAKFKANLWNRPNDEEQLLSISDQKIASLKRADGSDGPTGASTGVPRRDKSGTSSRGSSLRDLEEQYSKDRITSTDVSEVWFAGCHCDVGGGSVRNGTRPNLARIPLRWMIRECFKTKSGIMFETNGLRGLGLDPSSLYPEVLPRSPALPISANHLLPIPPQEQSKDEIRTAAKEELNETEQQIDLKDALSPIYDQLSLHWFWWVLELLPMWHRYQRSNNSWSYWLGANLGRGRKIARQEKDGVQVHRSVQRRLEAQYPDGTRYLPKADLNLERVTWVD